MYCNRDFQSDRTNTLIFAVIKLNISPFVFVLVPNTSACSHKYGTFKMFLLIGANFNLSPINENFLAPYLQIKNNIHTLYLYRMHHKIHVTVNLDLVFG